MKLKSGYVVSDLDGIVGIGPDCETLNYGCDGPITRNRDEALERVPEYWDGQEGVTPTQSEREEIAEMMIERWRKWAGLNDAAASAHLGGKK